MKEQCEDWCFLYSDQEPCCFYFVNDFEAQTLEINTKQYGCAVSVATYLENFNDFATDAVNEFSPIGLEQFGAMMINEDG